jgi:prevent-host-death family protein
MPEIGIRELKTNTSEIIRRVRNRQARYIITYRGQPVGLLLPLEEPEAGQGLQAGDPWDELIQLGQEIGQGWQADQTSGEILAAMRR